jgi:hypothetical protein
VSVTTLLVMVPPVASGWPPSAQLWPNGWKAASTVGRAPSVVEARPSRRGIVAVWADKTEEATRENYLE